MTVHPVLARQLKRLGLSPADPPPGAEAWRALLDRVSRAYGDADQDRYTLERSLSVSSAELQRLYEDLRRSSESQLAVERDKLAKSLALMRATQESAIDGIVYVDEAGRVTGYNRRFLELWRVPPELWSTQDGNALIEHASTQVADPVSYRARVEEVFRHTDASCRDEVVLADGRIFDRYSAPITSDGGAYFGRVTFFRDITESKRIERELREARDTAERASRAKSDFLSNMSHELRTPLNAILGFGRVLLGGAYGALNDRQTVYADHLVRAAEHMLRVINDLLDLRRIVDERVDLPLEAVALPAVVEEALAFIRPLVDERALHVEATIPEGLPSVRAEHRSLVQVLLNLLSNAAKFTRAGGRVGVSASVADGRVRIAVSDTGCGIAPEDRGRLFTYLEQLGGKHAHNMKGSGIGLALTKALVEKMGGAIEVESTVGVGSTFAVAFAAAG